MVFCSCRQGGGVADAVVESPAAGDENYFSEGWSLCLAAAAATTSPTAVQDHHTRRTTRFPHT